MKTIQKTQTLRPKLLPHPVPAEANQPGSYPKSMPAYNSLKKLLHAWNESQLWAAGKEVTDNLETETFIQL